jgi:ABC-type lipoprotein release transport system permease subunit
MEIMIIISIILIAAVAIWLVVFQLFKQKRKEVYICNSCGEHHCDCNPE